MRHWIFDLDGTLVDSFAPYFRSLEAIFARRGFDFPASLQRAALTEPLVLFFARHLGVPPGAAGQAQVAAALEELREISCADAEGIRAYPELLTAVRRLRESGAGVAVWTNRDLESAERILQFSGFAPYVELCVSGTCVARRKPHPEGFFRILPRFDCAAELVTMVGDHEHDIEAARAAGARAVRASWHGYWPIERCPDADFQFFRASDFADWANGALNLTKSGS